VLWDKKLHTIVNNESSEIIRILYSAFDEFLEPDLREANKPGGGFLPSHLRSEIDEMNDWVYNTVNNGVYKVGFATNQEAYDANIYPLFKSLDRLEAHLSQPNHQPYLFGQYITEADIRLYTTLARFDVAYHTIFTCNLKMIRHDYPLLSRWLRNLYWDESDRTNGGAFKNTTFFDVYKYGYLKARGRQLHGKSSDLDFKTILPRGPFPDIQPLTDEEEQQLINGTASLKIDTQGSSKASSNPFSAQGQGMGAMFSAGEDTPGTAAATDGTASQSPEGADGAEPNIRQEIKRRTTHSEENKKWYRAAKKAQKESGAPNMHLAL
jgi:glutathione S-transferase